MPDIKRLRTPLTADDIKSLKAGEQVLLTGKVYTARDMAHKILCQAIEQGKTLPFDLSGAVGFRICHPYSGGGFMRNKPNQSQLSNGQRHKKFPVFTLIPDTQNPQ